MRKPGTFIAVSMVVIGICSCLLLTGLGILRIARIWRPETNSEISGDAALRLLTDDFGGADKIPPSLTLIHGREDQSWDGFVVWMVFHLPHDQTEVVEQQIMEHYRQQPAKMQISINESKMTSDGRPLTFQEHGAPSWWDPQDVPLESLLVIQRPGSTVEFVFSQEKGMLFYHRQE